jgi:hypothetical protein
MHRPEIGHRPSGPLWSYGGLAAILAAIAAGALLLGVAWVAASGQRAADGQIAWVNLGIAGVLLPVVAGRRWVTTGRRAIGIRLSAVVADADPDTTIDLITPGADGTGRFVAGPATSRYHRPDCVLVAHKTITSGERRVHERAGRRSCEMCRP